MVMRLGISSEIQDRYTNINLSLDIMFVNKVVFMITILRNINFITSGFTPNRRQECILAATKKIKSIY